jgi:hypothetical protein
MSSTCAFGTDGCSAANDANSDNLVAALNILREAGGLEPWPEQANEPKFRAGSRVGFPARRSWPPAYEGLPATAFECQTSTVVLAVPGITKYSTTAVMASPRPTRYAPRSQAFSPCRGSDPDSRDRQCRHREPALGEPAADAARCPHHETLISRRGRLKRWLTHVGVTTDHSNRSGAPASTLAAKAAMANARISGIHCWLISAEMACWLSHCSVSLHDQCRSVTNRCQASRPK